MEQTTFAWNLIKLLRRERIDILHVQDPQVAILAQWAWRLGIVRTKTVFANGAEAPLDFLRGITYLQHLAPWHLEEARKAGVWRESWVAVGNFIDVEKYRPKTLEAAWNRCGGASSAKAVQSSETTRKPGVSGSKSAKSEQLGDEPAKIRAELGIPAEAIIVLCAAAIKRAHKRVDHVVREVSQLRNWRPEVPVWLVVAGGWEEETEDVIAEAERALGERVKFLVRFPRARMPDLYRMADIFTLGSIKEMMPIALLEATASGLPCVVNRHPVMEWMIGPGGVAIDMSQNDALARELERLAGDLESRRALGTAAREHCVANFSRDYVVEQILAYYERVVGDQNVQIRGVSSTKQGTVALPCE